MKKILLPILIITSFQVFSAVPTWVLSRVCEADITKSSAGCYGYSYAETEALCEAYSLPIGFIYDTGKKCDLIEDSLTYLQGKLNKTSNDRKSIANYKDYLNLCRAREQITGGNYFRGINNCKALSTENLQYLCMAATLETAFELKLTNLHYKLQPNGEYLPEHRNLPRQICLRIVGDQELQRQCMGMANAHASEVASKDVAQIIGDSTRPSIAEGRLNPFLKDRDEVRKKIMSLIKREARRANCGL